MNNYTFSHNGKTYERISKAKARKQFLQGETIYLLPCNARLDSAWISAFPVSKKQTERFATDKTGTENYFHNTVDSFEYYNCNHVQTGKYAAFYVERK